MGAMSQHHSVEWRCIISEPRLADPHKGQSLGVKNVEAAASIHQHLGETCLGDDGVDDQRITPGVGDPIRVILPIESDCALGPFEVRGHGCADCANFSEFALPLTRGETSRTSPKDQEAVLDLGESFSLGVVVLGGLFSALLDYDVGVIPAQDSALHKGVLSRAPMLGAWLLQHLIKETGASRSPLGVLAICRLLTLLNATTGYRRRRQKCPGRVTLFTIG